MTHVSNQGDIFLLHLGDYERHDAAPKSEQRSLATFTLRETRGVSPVGLREYWGTKVNLYLVAHPTAS